ncbi:MAG: helix-turn-helix domain-containing protein [Clostridia bacterium]|nr:helix-turn-helix domain-containing protein [Clostridia bacterium]
MFDPDQFASLLKKYRKAKGLTQNDVAQALWVTPQSVSKWERGEVLPSMEKLCALSKLLSVSLDVLLDNRSSDVRCFIGVDGGGTKTEFVLMDETGRCLNTIVLEGCNPNLCGVEKTIEIICRGIDYLRPQDMNALGIFVGASGFATANYADVIQNALSKVYPDQKIGCTTDVSNVIACSLSPDACIAAISGTGNVVYSKYRGELCRFGGTGYRFECGGSGYDMGREAISHTLRVGDGLDKPSRLSQLVTEKLGGPAWSYIQDFYKQEPAYIASFAPLVFKGAEENDSVAVEILHRNAEHMIRLIRRAKEHHPKVKNVILAGSIFQKNKVFYQLVSKGIEKELSVELAKLPPVWGACLQCIAMCRINSKPNANLFMESIETITCKKGERSYVSSKKF